MNTTTLEQLIEKVKTPAIVATAEELELMEKVRSKTAELEKTAKTGKVSAIMSVSAEITALEKELTKLQASKPKPKAWSVSQLACVLSATYGFCPATISLFAYGIAYIMHSAGLEAKIPSVRTTCAALYHGIENKYFSIPEASELAKALEKKAQELEKSTLINA